MGGCGCRSAAHELGCAAIAPRDEQRGVYEKFTVTRNDGGSAPGEKHYACKYFVLDLQHDIHALAALRAYAESCRMMYPKLADDLWKLADDIHAFFPSGGRNDA